MTTHVHERQDLPEGIQVRRVEVATTAHATYLFDTSGKLLHGTNRLSVEAMNEVRAAAGFEPIPHFHMEFPDYPVADMPTLPEGFEDYSWHNDMCPSFEHPGRGIQIWCDFADRELREFPESNRFCVRFTAGAPIIGEVLDDTFFFETEEWSEVEAYLRDRADEDRRKMLAGDEERLARIVTEKAIHEIALSIQTILGVPSGDTASLFFAEGGDERRDIERVVRGYMDTEKEAASYEGRAS